jgi:hypothetical protein
VKSQVTEEGAFRVKPQDFRSTSSAFTTTFLPKVRETQERVPVTVPVVRSTRVAYTTFATRWVTLARTLPRAPN